MYEPKDESVKRQTEEEYKTEQVKPLPKCPKCGAEIDSVNYYESGLMTFQGGEWVKDDGPDLETTCPECGEKISLDRVE